VLPATMPSGHWPSGSQYFFLGVRPHANWHASTHFFSEISRLRLARDRTRGTAHTSVQHGVLSHSTPQVFGSPAVTVAHSLAFSLPVTPLCAGYHRISTTMPGLALRNLVMCFRAWRAYSSPGPGSSNAIRRVAACTSEKIVTCSEATLL